MTEQTKSVDDLEWSDADKIRLMAAQQALMDHAMNEPPLYDEYLRNAKDYAERYGVPLEDVIPKQEREGVDWL